MEATRHKPVDGPQQGTIVYTRKVTSFNPKHNKNAGMSDEYINYRATKEAVDQYEKLPFRAATAAVALGIPVVDSLIAGASTKIVNTKYSNGIKINIFKEAPVADKAKIVLQRAKGWGIFLGAAMLVNKAANAVIKKVPSMKKFRDEHPAATGLGVLVGSVVAGWKAMNPIDNLISKAFNNNTGKGIKKDIKNLIKKSFLNKEGFKNFVDKYVFKPVKNFVESPKGEKVLLYGGPALLGGVIAKEIFDVASAKQKQQQVKHQLEMQRVKSQAEIVKKIVIEQVKIQSSQEA
ncbi:MAG: hypothetical protein A2Y25_03465 [Candidatus Melainabacteria bacterium GWF2_37_15]|nr:MAG: hypothetical protein A2Y25_03465 [Candidatus Melainabacteria bacterium GWF2_37_15]